MNAEEVLRQAYAMPLENPSYPPGPYRFVNREFLIVTYRTDPDALRAVVPEPLDFDEPLVKYEFIRMPDSTGFGDYTESGQVIPVKYRDGSGDVQNGGFVLSMFLDDDPPIAGGRELWGFPKKLAHPKLSVRGDTLVGELDFGSTRVATATMGYKHSVFPAERALHALHEPGFLLKIIPHVDGTPRVCELVRYHLLDVDLKGAWSGPAALRLEPHALAPVADLPILEVLSGVHLVADLTLGLGEVVHDYLAG
jgi:acetoacetate decarboxylase